MSTSDKRQARHTACVYLGVSVFCGLFSLIYEHFSHGVYSGYMVFLFLFPLLGGVLPFVLLPLIHGARYPAPAARTAWQSGVVTLTVGSGLHGIFDIYGTTAPLVTVYWAAGAALSVAGLLLYLWKR